MMKGRQTKQVPVVPRAGVTDEIIGDCDRYDVEAQKYADTGKSDLVIRVELTALRDRILNNLRALPFQEDVASIVYVNNWLRRRGGWEF